MITTLLILFIGFIAGILAHQVWMRLKDWLAVATARRDIRRHERRKIIFVDTVNQRWGEVKCGMDDGLNQRWTLPDASPRRGKGDL